jgi:hypothetical protein
MKLAVTLLHYLLKFSSLCKDVNGSLIITQNLICLNIKEEIVHYLKSLGPQQDYYPTKSLKQNMHLYYNPSTYLIQR